MIRKNKLPELLAPAGSMEALYAGVEAGADAIYVGGKRFGARAFAKNFDGEEMQSAVKYCHLHGVKLYVTVNTLIFDREMPEVVEYARYLYKIGVDAVICADLGVIKMLKAAVPELEIHASTQMCVHNTEGALMAARLGCKRVVLARELSFSDICKVTRDCPVETEVFLHGALCVCHSGQCLFSSLVGGRSGNRGECAQPCRLPYNNGKYVLSLSDLSLAFHVRELIASGTASLKIEGRMKSPDYVFAVTSIYRRLLDEGRNATEEEQRALSKIFSRGGFTDGYFTGNLSKMTGVRTEADKNDTRTVTGRTFEPLRVKVTATASFIIGKPAEMTLTDGDRTVSVTGDIVAPALSAPLSADAVKQRLSKMGNTFLSLSPEDIKIELDEGANLSVGAINSLRRLCTEKFEGASDRVAVETGEVPPRVKKSDGIRSALFLNASLLRDLKSDALSSFDAVFAPLFSEGDWPSAANGVYLPPVLLDADFDKTRARLYELKSNGVLYTLVCNLSQIELSLQAGFIPVADFRMNITNSHTAAALFELGVAYAVLSAELDLPKARDIGGGIVAYGRIPLMITERCFVGENFSCKECGKARLCDRRGKEFPMLREYDHRTLILNSEITYMADRAREISSAGLKEHFIFTVETADEVGKVLRAFSRGDAIQTVFPSQRPRRLGMREAEPEKQKKNIHKKQKRH